MLTQKFFSSFLWIMGGGLHNWLFFMDVWPHKGRERLVTCSATSRCILVLFERSGCPKKMPKKVLVTLFPYMFYVKTKLNIVYKNLTKIFSRDTNILPQMHWTSNIFGHSVTTIGLFWASLNYPVLNFKNMVCSKNIWMWHWYARFIFNNYRSFVNALLHFVRSYVVMVFAYVEDATVKLRKTKSLVMQLHISC